LKASVWISLAKAVVLESLRRKDVWVVAILGALILAASGALGFFGMKGLEAFAKDLAVTVLGVFSTVLAVLVSTRLLPEEIRNRTLYPLLARPITRFDLLFGKFLGAAAVSWIAFGLLAGVTLCALVLFGVRPEPIMGQYALAKALGLVVVCALGLSLSAYMTAPAATTLALVLAFGSDMISRALVMAYPTADPGSKAVFHALNWLLPHFGVFDFGARVANVGWSPVPLWVLGALAGYMALYSAGLLGLAWARFRKQAV